MASEACAIPALFRDLTMDKWLNAADMLELSGSPMLCVEKTGKWEYYVGFDSRYDVFRAVFRGEQLVLREKMKNSLEMTE